jgi:hypothetical protein
MNLNARADKRKATIASPSFNDSFNKKFPDSDDSPIFQAYNARYNRIYQAIRTDIEIMETARKTGIPLYARAVPVIELSGREFVNHVQVNDIIWLFANSTPIDFYERLQNLILKKDDISLEYNDYVVLLYASYHEEKMKENLTDFPLPILHEMYLPLALEIKDRIMLKRKLGEA